MKIHSLSIIFLALVGSFFGAAFDAIACPGCGPLTAPTKSENLAQSDAVVLVQWVEATKSKGRKTGYTTFEILQVVKGPGASLKKGKRVTLPSYRSGKKGNLFLLTGINTAGLKWDKPLEVTETSFNYIAQAPSPETPVSKRLEYYLRFLEFPDQLVANDAYTEFAKAPFKEIATLKEKLPRKKLRQWLASEKTSPTRLGLYGILLGICGQSADETLMREIIIEPTEEFRLGIEGLMFGYMLMTGADGLDLIDRYKLKTDYILNRNGKPVQDKEGNQKPLPFTERYAALQALRIMWSYGEDRISKNRLRQSMRILLDQPKLADLVIANLARWKDWSVQDKLMSLYGAEEYNIPPIKRAIVRYMLVSTRNQPVAENVKPPPHVVKGKKYLAKLRKKDPKIVREAERFF